MDVEVVFVGQRIFGLIAIDGNLDEDGSGALLLAERIDGDWIPRFVYSTRIKNGIRVNDDTEGMSTIVDTARALLDKSLDLKLMIRETVARVKFE